MSYFVHPFPFSSLLLKSFFTSPLSLLCWFGNNILVFITLVDTLEITMSILNLLNSTLIHIFIFFLQNTKMLKNSTPVAVIEMFLRSSDMVGMIDSWPQILPLRILYQFCAESMLSLGSSHAFPRMTTVRAIVSAVLAQCRFFLMDKFYLRTPHWPGGNILRPVLQSGPLSTQCFFFLLSFLTWETCIEV